jgi:hypothetical protein
VTKRDFSKENSENRFNRCQGKSVKIFIGFEETCEDSSKEHNYPNDLFALRNKETKKHETNDLMSRGHSGKDTVSQFPTENKSMKV